MKKKVIVLITAVILILLELAFVIYQKSTAKDAPGGAETTVPQQTAAESLATDTGEQTEGKAESVVTDEREDLFIDSDTSGSQNAASTQPLSEHTASDGAQSAETQPDETHSADKMQPDSTEVVDETETVSTEAENGLDENELEEDIF